jgi:hypothetical protein
MPFRRLGERWRGLGRHLGAPRGGGVAFLPSDIAGLTGWWDASDATTLYTDAGSTLVSSDGDLVYRMSDKSGGAGNRYMQQTNAALRWTYRENVQNGLSAAEQVDSADTMTSLALSNFVAADESFYFIVWCPNGSPSNGQVMNDPSFYTGLTDPAGNTYYFKNWDGAYKDTATISVTPGTWLVTCFWLTGGNVYIQKNDDSASSPVASGNTTNLTGALHLFRTLNTGYFGEAGTYNLGVAEGDRNALISGLMTKWGVS